ncbi:hypothetical protein A2155_02265 [candidate division WWE3 bacterium RBG_16_52_45]|nr:MAG: hypothetical protein A2155_02265 [candidate division WWE3 bacterium RBG_16_52_45]
MSLNKSFSLKKPSFLTSFENKKKIFSRIKKLFLTPLPLYLALLLAINFGVLAAAGEYVLLTRGSSGGDSATLVQDLKAEILPAEGYSTSLTWGDLGKKLVEAGAIDKDRFTENHRSPTAGGEDLDILEGGSDKPLKINENNSGLVLNLLWAFGLTQKSKVLDEGPMKSGDYSIMDFASTAGWTLGAKKVEQLYSSTELAELNNFQQDLVKKIAENVYRPCCDNPTSFPDCNHGMAALGLIELEVAAGISEEQIYRDVLAFNSFWFPQTYLEIAVYFNRQGKGWNELDPKTILGREYSSASGSAGISNQVKDTPGLDSGGGSCGV